MTTAEQLRHLITQLIRDNQFVVPAWAQYQIQELLKKL